MRYEGPKDGFYTAAGELLSFTAWYVVEICSGTKPRRNKIKERRHTGRGGDAEVNPVARRAELDDGAVVPIVRDEECVGAATLGLRLGDSSSRVLSFGEPKTVNSGDVRYWGLRVILAVGRRRLRRDIFWRGATLYFFLLGVEAKSVERHERN